MNTIAGATLKAQFICLFPRWGGAEEGDSPLLPEMRRTRFGTIPMGIGQEADDVESRRGGFVGKTLLVDFVFLCLLLRCSPMRPKLGG